MVSLLEGTAGLNYNFGELKPGSISGKVHADLNGNCVFEPSDGEHPLAGVAIELLNENGQVIDGRPLSLDYDNEQYVDGYWSLQRALDQRFRDEGSQISRTDYKSRYALYAFDLSPSQCTDKFVDPTKKGKLTLELQFAKTIPKTLTLCVYLQFEASVIINEYREVVTKFSGRG